MEGSLEKQNSSCHYSWYLLLEKASKGCPNEETNKGTRGLLEFFCRKFQSEKNGNLREESFSDPRWLRLGLQWPENATYICCLSLANDVLTRISLNEVKCIIC